MAFCVRCGKQLPENYSFCPACGMDLRDWKQTAPQAPVENTPPVMAEQQTSVPQAQPVEEQIPACQAQPAEEQIPACQAQPAEEAQIPVQQGQPLDQEWKSLQQIRQESEASSAPQWQPSVPVRQAEPTQVPGKALCIIGKILGILSFAAGLTFMVFSLLLMALLTTGEIIMADIGLDTQVLTRFLLSGAEVLAMSVVGLILSNKARDKGNPDTGKGRIFSLLGVVFTAIFLANIVLCLIVCAFSQGGLSL